MTKILHKMINSCRECPCAVYDSESDLEPPYYCNYGMEFHIKDLDSIPETLCPLPELMPTTFTF